MATPQYVSYRELRARGISFTRKHILQLMREGKFPLARQISSNRVAWIETEIGEWLANRPVSKALSAEGEAKPRVRFRRRAAVPEVVT